MKTSPETVELDEIDEIFDWCPRSEKTLADAEEKLKIFEMHRDATMRAMPSVDGDLLDFEIDAAAGGLDHEQLLREMEERHRQERGNLVAGFGKALRDLSESLRQPAEHANEIANLKRAHSEHVQQLNSDHTERVTALQHTHDRHVKRLSTELSDTQRALDSVANERDRLRAQLCLVRETHAADIKRIKLAVLQQNEE